MESHDAVYKADIDYLNNVLTERAFREISEELSMTCSLCVKFTI